MTINFKSKKEKQVELAFLQGKKPLSACMVQQSTSWLLSIERWGRLRGQEDVAGG